MMWEAFLAILTLSMATGAAPEQHCKYDNVIRYLNISSEKPPPLRTIPKGNWDEPLKVEMQFILMSILSVTEKLQTVTVYFLLAMKWKDVFATWNPQDFCNISKLVLPVDTFWSPYIVIYEQVDEEKSLSRPFLSITHNGIISTTQQHRVTITCNLEMHKFPFDIQTCSISLFSFNHPGAAREQLCKYDDVLQYLNISSEKAPQLHTIPKENWKEPLKVEIEFILISILLVTEKLQTVTIYFLVTMKWKNVFVTWNPQDFCNISKLVLPVDTFWSPYIIIYEQVDEEKSLSRPLLSITHNGMVSTTQQHQVTVTCSLEMHQFPFDTQMCNMSIASVKYSATDIIFQSNQTSEEANKQSQLYHLTNGEWKFTNINIIQYTDLLEEEFVVITYEISMKRRPILYVLNLIFPTCALYILDMAILFSASSYGDKISFQLSLIIGESVLAVILKDILPTSSDDPPIIVMFFIGVFVLMIMGVLETCLLMQLKKKPLHPLLRATKLLRCRKQARTSGSLLHKQGDSLTDVARGQEESRDSNPLGKGNTELPMLTGRMNAEGQRIGTQAELQESESALLVLEKVLFCSHLLLSLLFSIIIIVQWSS
ncbi:acetylcholine receptor subunit alpha-like [Pangshura tecta]